MARRGSLPNQSRRRGSSPARDTARRRPGLSAASTDVLGWRDGSPGVGARIAPGGEVAADPDTAWRLLGDLAAVDRWIPGVTKVELDGLTRRCTFADGHTQREEISDYSPATRSYRYTIDGGLPVADNRGRFAVEPTGTGARIVWESSFTPLDPATEQELGRMWAAMLPIVLGNLKTLVDQGSRER